MSQVKAVRRALAKIRYDEAADTIPHIGHKQVHHFWPVLSPCFRNVLVAPHHRTDEDAVTWTWREAEEAGPPSSAELTDLRRSLAEAMERFVRDIAAGKVGRGSGSSVTGPAGNTEQLEAVMTTLVRDLAGRPDAELKRFVCRTENGLRVHSWGAGAPACPTYPDTHGLEIAGRVLVAGRPARHDVVLESTDGETIAEVPSDDGGEFSFSKLSPGEYRLRARSVRGTFPPHGLPVELTHRSVKDLVLADTRAEMLSPLVSARRAAGRRSRRLLPLAVVAVVTAAGGWWGWRSLGSRDERVAASAPSESQQPLSPVDRVPAGPVSSDGVRGSSENAVVAAAGSPAPGALGGIGSTPVAVAPERRALAVEVRESGAGGLPGGSAGAAAGGSLPPPASGPGGTSPAGVAPVSNTSLRLPTPPSAQPAVVTGGGTASGVPPVSAAAATPAPVARPPLPAPAAPTAAAAAPSASVAAVPAATPAAPPARSVDASPAPIAAPVAIVVPVVPPVSATEVKTVPSDVAAAVDPRPDVARPPAETVASSVPVVPPETVPEKVIPVTPASESPTPVPAVAPVVPVGLPSMRTRAAPVPLTRTVRVRVAPWRPRLLVDTILPTEPKLLAEPEPVAVLRARLLAEQEARLPRAFRAPEGRVGVAIELGAEFADEPMAWLDDVGARPESARVSGPRAEILWPASADGNERVFRLTRRDGAMVAEIRVAGNGRDFSVRTMEESLAWLRLAVRVAPTAAAPVEAEAGAKGFSWRSATAGPLPPGWREGESPAAGDERIVEAPLGSVPGAAALQAGALFDVETGWAILADVRQAADRPLGQ
jgi:hypothetical protein